VILQPQASTKLDICVFIIMHDSLILPFSALLFTIEITVSSKSAFQHVQDHRAATTMLA
jgi:hypothetical protein